MYLYYKCLYKKSKNVIAQLEYYLYNSLKHSTTYRLNRLEEVN